MIQALTKNNFLDTLKKEDVVLVDFYADWCGPCQTMSPLLDEISNELKGKATIAKVDVDIDRSLAGAFNIRSIPTMILFKEGAPVDIMVGLQTKASLLEKIEAELAVASVA